MVKNMDKKQIIIIELIVVVCILIAGIAITLNLNNQATPIANNTTEAVVNSVTQDESSSQEQPYSARFENSEYKYNPATDRYTKEGSSHEFVYDYVTEKWIDTSIPGHQVKKLIN